MNTCTDCIHYNVCQYHITEETTFIVEECSYGFKHKDQYVFMPAYVGQEVWKIYHNHEYDYENKKFNVIGYELKNGKVSMLQQKADKSWKIRITVRSNVGDYTIDEFNKYVYLTEEAARVELVRLEEELSKNKI